MNYPMANILNILKNESALRVFLRSEASGGMLLMAAAAAAMLCANSGLSSDYFAVLNMYIGPMSLLHWINDALMAVFFLLVGIEVKREFSDGHLTSWADRRLPVVAAGAGMALPAFVYLGFTAAEPSLLRGWAIPAATDIAFAMGVLALLGRRVPTSLKLLLATIAIVDDVGAVAVIAFFYTDDLNMAASLAAFAVWLLMLLLGRIQVVRLWPYCALAVVLWVAVFLSGIHATIAGVMAAFAIPFRRTIAAPDAKDSVLHRLEHLLAKPVAFIIVPLFGFANAGVTLGQESALDPLPLGIAAGLFVGKQVGIFGSIWLAVKFGLSTKPAHASWGQIYGIALLCGIGFTMSLFIGGLAFNGPHLADSVKIGVLMGSLLSAIAGWIVLRFVPTNGPSEIKT
jgi:NhaA family Na+:H+ antiporter